MIPSLFQNNNQIIVIKAKEQLKYLEIEEFFNVKDKDWLQEPMPQCMLSTNDSRRVTRRNK